MLLGSAWKAEWLRTHADLLESPLQLPTPISGHSRLPGTPAQGSPTVFLGL